MAAGFEAIALLALVIALVPVHDPAEVVGWTFYGVEPARGSSRLANLGVFDPAIWFGAAVAMAVAGAVVFAMSVAPSTGGAPTEPPPDR